MWIGMLVGMLAGVGAVVAVGYLGPAIHLQVRGAVVGALTGVLLAPVLVVGSFLAMLASMFVMPWSLEGMLGESLWSRLARALNERRLRPLFFPLLFFVVLPMALCALGGSRMKTINTPILFAAGLGAVVLGAILGAACGALAGKARKIAG
jgi:hypothetical protein